ncbi:NAD+ synthase [Natronospirillum operosum]|uniref:Glutamine-dependent NAD(+) synthetase n=1 Tax=Natronospirillum operosum TaxID=2759953 RepID=A0A4Z0WBX8_9GAMM|nr:NAD+ synthase [Natronospirillum operosum]TGG91080.1 NAD+ synthase [Natronospirillum operosum]
MTEALRVQLVQDDFPVGDIPGNAGRILQHGRQAQAEGARVVVFPELTLSGYPPEDLLLRPSLQTRVEAALAELQAARLPLALVVGLPWHDQGQLYNAAFVIDHGEIVARYRKRHLPNYQVFDEHRYFACGSEVCSWDCDGVRLGLTICEDVWFDDVLAELAQAGTDLVLTLNASPFHLDRAAQRRAMLMHRARQHGLPMVYVNAQSAQDELVFDGSSMVLAADGTLRAALPEFRAATLQVAWQRTPDGLVLADDYPCVDLLGPEASVYEALKQGLASYVNRNGFPGVVLGLSGGIDSALSLAIAADALGPERVRAVMMPFRYTSSISQEDAQTEAEALGVDYHVLPIESLYDTGMAQLNPLFEGYGADVTEQNLQSRLRGLLLMALSNKWGHMVLTTGNKSELAVGYATLYGDMCGGYNALKDVPKLMVFRLARYRNSLGPVIPERVITRPPSAELAPDQKDEDSLPAYDILDPIIERYVEHDESAETIVAAGFDRETVYKVVRLIDRNEYKRRQAPEGVRVTARGFGRDRRYPITHAWAPGE